MRAVLRDVAANLALAAAYFGTAKLGLVFALFGPNVSLIWPASGIAVAVLVLAGLRLFPGVAIGAFLANLTLGSPPLTAAVIALGAALADGRRNHRVPGRHAALGSKARSDDRYGENH